jgi:hypothetical protein
MGTRDRAYSINGGAAATLEGLIGANVTAGALALAIGQQCASSKHKGASAVQAWPTLLQARMSRQHVGYPHTR